MLQQVLVILFIIRTSIYSLSFTTIDGASTSFQAYQGKKILIVNIATSSDKADQLAELQQLQAKFQDSLVVIAFPSNSFGHEPRADADIKQFCQSQYGTTFLLASKTNVSGANLHPVYNWLANKTENGSMDGELFDDFQKFLIEKDGSPIGVFAPAVNPMDTIIQNAITGN